MERTRESYGFVIYFVITDSIFYLVPIIISTFSLARFAQGATFIEGVGRIALYLTLASEFAIYRL